VTNTKNKINFYLALGRYLMVSGKARFEALQFDGGGKIVGFGLLTDDLVAIIESGVPFQTSGCPDCNRPYYNEKPSGPIYNYPTALNRKEIETAKKQLLNL
jgi:biotin synthase